MILAIVLKNCYICVQEDKSRGVINLDTSFASLQEVHVLFLIAHSVPRAEPLIICTVMAYMYHSSKHLIRICCPCIPDIPSILCTIKSPFGRLCIINLTRFRTCTLIWGNARLFNRATGQVGQW